MKSDLMREATPDRASNEGGWNMTLFVALLLLCTWGVLVSRLHDPLRFWNFGYIHDGSLCFQDRCDPYDVRFLDRVGQLHGESARFALNPEYPVYPPATLLLAIPLNPLGWPGSALAFFGFSIFAYGAAIVAMVRSVRFGPWVAGSIVLLALLASRSPWRGLYYGNPVMPCAGLMTAACALLLSVPRRHDLAATVLLALALCIKPQLAVGAVVFLLWRRDTRRAAWATSLIFVAFSILATVLYAVRLGGFAFLSTESRILQLGFQRGHSSDGSLLNPNAFRFLNLEPLLSALHLGSVSAKIVTLAVTVCLGALLFHTAKGDAMLKQRPWTIASTTAVCSWHSPPQPWRPKIITGCAGSSRRQRSSGSGPSRSSLRSCPPPKGCH